MLHYYGLLEESSDYKILCPLPGHDDVNPSFQISLGENFFHCHGCNESGDALKFVMLINKDMDDLEACKLYYEILRSDKVKHLHLTIKHKQYKENGQATVEAEDYYYGLKYNNWKKSSWEKEYMLDRGFNSDTLTKCKAKINYNAAYPIVFPMLDMHKFKGWVCRTTTKRIAEKRKYLYNEGFSRSNTIVGKYDNKVVMLVEGYMDYLKTKQYGMKYSGAILGWKVTAQQVEKLKEQGVKYIISALDNDDCGRKGTKYLKQFFTVIRFQYPKNIKDPGDMTKEQFLAANDKTIKLYRRTINNGINR